MEKLHSDKITKSSANTATQQYLDVSEIKDDVIILKNGGLRAVLAISAINFELKSTDEQEAIINQYQNFLNSINFPLQTLITSRKLNIESYIGYLADKEKLQRNELLRMQISEYKNFIRQLVSISNIMEKTFYIVVPFSPMESTDKGFLTKFRSMTSPKRDILEKRENFETYKSQLFQRIDHIVAALSGIGLRIIPLKTQELLELLFNSYNPSIYTNVALKDSSELEIKSY